MSKRKIQVKIDISPLDANGNQLDGFPEPVQPQQQTMHHESPSPFAKSRTVNFDRQAAAAHDHDSPAALKLEIVPQDELADYLDTLEQQLDSPTHRQNTYHRKSTMPLMKRNMSILLPPSCHAEVKFYLHEMVESITTNDKEFN